MTKICNRCHKPVKKETDQKLIKEYPFYCETCDENKYNFEVSKSKKDMIERLVQNDINDVLQESYENQHSFLESILRTGWKGYETMTEEELKTEYDNREFPDVGEWFAYEELGCFYRLNGEELEFSPMNSDGTRTPGDGGFVDFELMEGEDIYKRLVEIKKELENKEN